MQARTARSGWWLSTALIALSVACSGNHNASPGDASVPVNDDASMETASKSNASTAQAGKSGSTPRAGSSARTGSDEDAGTVAGRGARKQDVDSGMSSEPTKSSASNKPSESTEIPTDGNQLALCAMVQGECNKGFACRAPANAFSSGRGFCSQICEADSDCSGLTPDAAHYVCGEGNGIKTCDLVCKGEDDTESCPAHMDCVQIGPVPNVGPVRGDAGAREAEFRCRYPFETSDSWGPCDDGVHVCADGLSCSVTSPFHPGRCVQSCKVDADCQDKPSSGSITPSCATIVPARGMNEAIKRCVLDCSDAKDGCPTDTSCVDAPAPRGRGNSNMQPAYSRCG